MPPQTISSTYDPTSQTPYQPVQLPEIQPPPTAAPPPSTSPQDALQSGPRVLPNAGGRAAGVAYLASSLLKGIAQGRSMAEIKKVAQAKKNLDGLQFAYNMAAQQLGGLIKSEADPNSPEVQQARAARDASWQALMKAYGTYMGDGQQKPKKSKNKAQSQPQSQGVGAGAGGDQGNLIAELASPDPAVKREAYYKLAIKLGPPDEWQIRQWNSPQAKQQRDLAQRETQASLDIENKKLRLHELQNDPAAKTDPNKQQELERLQTDPELFPQLSRATPHYATFPTLGSSLKGVGQDALGNPIDPAGYYREETVSGETRWVPSAPPTSSVAKLGSPQAFMEQWAKENNVDPKNIPAETQRQLDQAWRAPAGITVSTHNGQVMWTDTSGNTWQIPVSTTTTTARTGGTMPTPSATPPAAKPKSTTPTHTPATTSASTPSVTQSTSATAPTPPIPGAKFIGKKALTPDEKLQQAIKLKDASLAGKVIEDAKKDYSDAIKRQATMDQNIIAARNGDQQAMLSLLANHIGMTLGAQKGARITRAIWEEAIASAPWTKTVYAKWFHNDPATGDMIFDGYKTGVTLTNEQMQQMVDLAHQKVKILSDSIPQMEKLYKDELSGKGLTTTPEKSAPHPVDQVLDDIFKPKTQ